MGPIFAPLMALLAALAWGIGGVSQKTVLTHLDTFTTTGIASLLGALVLLPVARREALRKISVERPKTKTILTIALLFSAATVLEQAGYGTTSVANAGFFVNASAVITPFAAWAMVRQRPPLWIYPASSCALAGMCLMSGAGFTAFNSGDLVCLASAVAFSAWMIVMGEHVTLHRDPVGITCSQLAFCGFTCLVLGFLFHGLPSSSSFAKALPDLLIVGIIAKALAFCLCAAVQQRVSAGVMAVLASADAVFGAFFAMLLIHEIMTQGQIAGALLVSVGIAIVSLKTNHLPQPIRAAN
jgi:drug/metabolite transporter (DMT)-like permease